MQPAKAPTVSAFGADIPVIGYGTMKFPDPEQAVGLITHALESGYCHIDTARKYHAEHSEQFVGEAIRASNLPREDLWVTTKVTEDNAKADDFARSVEASLDMLGLDYVDLLLIHWHQPKVPLEETLGALAKAKREGLAKNVGVSNFTVALIEEAAGKTTEPLVVNQVEYHAYFRQDKVLDACRKHGMLVTCHAPLARGAVMKDPVIQKIAKNHGKTPAQVALKWLVQQPGIIAIPRGLEFSEIEDNIDLFDFELSEDDMNQISPLRDNSLRVVQGKGRHPEWDVD